MEYKYEKLTDKIYVCASSDHRFGTDAFLLADFSQYRAKDKACDLGTGCGIIPLRLGLEKSETAGIVPICADLKELWEGAPLGQLDLVTCNPPYKVNNAGFQSVITAQKIARHEILCTIDDVCAAAQKLLKFGGRLCVCNRPERLSDVIYAMKCHDIEPKRLRFVSKNAEEAPWLFLIEGKKGSKPFMKVEPQLYIRSENGFTEELQKIYDTGKEQV